MRWIVWNSAGTHAEVRAADGEAPLETARWHRLIPGETYYGIPYNIWAERTGEPVDVPQLQAHLDARRRREQRPLYITPQIRGDDWQAESSIPTTAPASDYGFTTGTKTVECSRDQLIRQCVEVPETPAVWTPHTGGLVPPEAVPFLVEAHRIHRREVAGTSASLAGAAFLITATLALGTSSGPRSGWIVPFALAAAWLATALYESRQAGRGDKESFAAARQQHRHESWLHSRAANYTWTILILLSAVMVAEMFGLGEAIEAAGLVKPEVREGELWRLLTGALLHGGPIHLAFNLLALWSLGPLVEAHAGRAMLPIVFLYSALVGSIASFLLIPNVTSVGASGGILGLIGFLFVLGYRRRHALPPNFVRRMGIGILATAIFGIVGFALVDNATHLGGLFTGMLLAGFLPTDIRDSGTRSRRSLNVVGDLALAIIVLGAAGSVGLIYRSIVGS